MRSRQPLCTPRTGGVDLLMNKTEKLDKLQKARLLALGAMQTLNPKDGDPADLDEELYGAWLEFQAAWMTTQDAFLRLSLEDKEEGADGN